MTHAGRKRSPEVYGHHHTGKESLDINFLKAEHPILCLLPTKLAEWIADNLSAELRIAAKKEAKWTVGGLNPILARNLVPNGDGGHFRTFATLQRECELYNGRPKARCLAAATRLIWMDIAFEARILGYIVCYIACYITCYVTAGLCLPGGSPTLQSVPSPVLRFQD